MSDSAVHLNDDASLIKPRWFDQPPYIQRQQQRGELNFAWWNTSLSPARGDSRVKDRKQILDVILNLAAENDFVGLCEIAEPQDFEYLNINLPPHRKLMPLLASSGKLQFKTACIYNEIEFEASLEFDRSSDNFVTAGSAAIDGQYRIGQKVRLRSKNILDARVDVYLVHWSQKNEANGESRKSAAAARLYRDMFGDDSERCREAAIVLMGDFNTEPYSSAFVSLKSSRSPSYVEKEGGLFNPFWRRLHDDNGSLNCKNTSDIRAPKALFDCIMVSSPFLRLPNFQAIERVCGYKTYDPQHSEHHPVTLTMKWRT